MTDAPTKRLPEPRHSTNRSDVIQHVTVDGDGDIAVCTMFPRDHAEANAATEWLTACGEAFVSLEDAR